MYHIFIKVDQGHHVPLLIWGVIQQCVYDTIHNVDDLRKNARRKLGMTLTRTLSVLPLSRPRSRVHAGDGHFEHML